MLKKLSVFFDSNTFYEGWIDEGISIPTMQYFDIRWYELRKAIIIPHLDVQGNLVGIRRRSLLAEDANNKYMPLNLNGQFFQHPLNNNLYGLYQHQEAIRKRKKVMVVESEKSVMLAHEYYQDHAFVVATCGFNVSNWQRDKLLSMGVEEVILGFDKDYDPLACEEEGHPQHQQYLAFMNRILKIAEKFTPFCRTYVLWDNLDLLQVKDSPLDRGQTKLEKLMKNKVEITTGC